jgi:glycosyltransferase involved in cell wall biosynthesis
MNTPSQPPAAPKISCIICAFNEGPRIGAVLDVATSHPLLAEVIVVDDGSSDDTARVVARYPAVRLIAHATNQGKSQAMATGVGAARHDLLMLLDADLKGLRAADLDLLARPVLEGRAAASMSLRRNSLAVFRGLGIDFVSGERVVDKRLLVDALNDLHALPRFGVEVVMNQRIIAAGRPIAIANWREVRQSRKTEKLGWWRGVRAEWRMVLDLLRAVPPLELLTQTVRLSALRSPHRPRQRAPGATARDASR